MQTYALLAALAATAAAVVTPVGAPNGNAITKPGSGDIVTAGSTFNIIWEPSTPKDGTITLVLCKGPSTNCVTQTPPIVEGLKNTGSYAWSVPTSLEPTNGAAQGYGIQLIVEANGQNQYTTQFGVANPDWKNTSSSSSASASKSSTASASKSASASATASGSATASASHSASKTSKVATTTATASVGTTGGPVTTESVTPTAPLTVPTSLQTSTTAAATTSPARVTSPNAAAPTGNAKIIGWAAAAGMGIGALVL